MNASGVAVSPDRAAAGAPVPVGRTSEDDEALAANRLRLALPDCVFLFLALFVGLGRNRVLLNGDGDVGRHLRVGEWVLTNGIPRVDFFSHTRAGEPFRAYEWLSEAVFALAHAAAGLPGVVALSAILIGATYAVVCTFLRQRGVEPLLAFLIAVAASVLGSPHFLARPHLFTFLAVSLLLFRLHPESVRSSWWLMPFFVLWANLHPGFMFGLGILGVMLAGALLEQRLPGTRPAPAGPRYYAAALGWAFLGSLVNPNGFELHQHILGHMSNGFLISATHEFMSPDFHGSTGRVFLVVILGVVAVLAHIRTRPPYPHLLAILACLALALTSQRNIPLFGLVALPLLAIHGDIAWRTAGNRVLAQPRRVFALAERVAVRGLWSVPAAVFLLGFALLGGSIGPLRVMPAGFDERTFPVQLVREARAAGLEGNLFNDFVWGGYLLHAWPERPVFIDGATDFYGNQVTAEYLQVTQLVPGWREVLERRAISLVLLPSVAPLTHVLEGDPDWEVWGRDGIGTLLRRREGE